MAAVSDFLDEVVLGASSADGPVQAWDVRTGMQIKAYKCVHTSVGADDLLCVFLGGLHNKKNKNDAAATLLCIDL